MAVATHRVRHGHLNDGDVVVTRKVHRVDDVLVEDDLTDLSEGQIVAVNIVWYVAGVLLALLGLRFVLALFGANPANMFVDFIYTISYPLAAPFFSIFNYQFQYGVDRFELFTLIAMLVYTLIAWGITRLMTINRR